MTSDYNVEKILDKRRFGDKTYYLVKWENYTFDESTWEPKSNLNDATDCLEDFRQCHPLDRLKKKITKYANKPDKRKEYEYKFREMQAYIDKLTRQKEEEMERGDKNDRRSGSTRNRRAADCMVGKKRSRPVSSEPRSVEELEEKEKSPVKKAKKTDWVGNSESQDSSDTGESKKEIKEIEKEVVLKSFQVSWKPAADGTKKQPTLFTLKEMEEKYPEVLAEYYKDMSKKFKG